MVFKGYQSSPTEYMAGGGGGCHSNTANQLWRDQVSFVVREPKFSHPTPLLGD